MDIVMFVSTAVTSIALLSLFIMSSNKGSHFYDAKGDPGFMDSKTLASIFIAIMSVHIGLNSYYNP